MIVLNTTTQTTSNYSETGTATSWDYRYDSYYVTHIEPQDNGIPHYIDYDFINRIKYNYQCLKRFHIKNKINDRMMYNFNIIPNRKLETFKCKNRKISREV